MKIKSIKLTNNKILGDLFLDFTDNNKISNTIIIAGENGCGKSTILNIIYEFSNLDCPNKMNQSNEIREFTIQLSNEEIQFLRNNNYSKAYFSEDIIGNEIKLVLDYSITNWDFVSMIYSTNSVTNQRIAAVFFSFEDIKALLKSIFSDVEINFNSQNIQYVTSKNVDEIVNKSKKSSNNLATEITQLLIDVQALDDADFAKWGRENIGQPINKDMIDIRMKRFKSAFNFMFPDKRYKEIRNEQGYKKVIFEENGKDISMENLSSGEKQIVFRGSFLLKDQKSSKGSVVLIDEPEISLHPRWQLKILDFFKMLFTNEQGMQTSQIFVVTHSPFIIHNENRLMDKVIILNKSKDGNITIPDVSEFYGWTPETLVKKAFFIDDKIDNSKPLIITEGKTDWKHMKSALRKLKSIGKFSSLDIEFFEYEEETKMGDSELKRMCEQFSKTFHNNKIIFVFDRDVEQVVKEVREHDKEFKNWGNNIFPFPIPVPSHRKTTPEICIEFYYKDEEIKHIDKDGRRLFINNEFNNISGRHNRENLNCTDSKYRSKKIAIIDDNVFNEQNENIALPKNDFANYILNDTEGYDNFDVYEFEKIFNVIDEIINK